MPPKQEKKEEKDKKVAPRPPSEAMTPGQRMRLEELEAALASAKDRESLLQLEVPLAGQHERDARVRYFLAIARAQQTTREKKEGLREMEREIRALEAEKDCILRNVSL